MAQSDYDRRASHLAAHRLAASGAALLARAGATPHVILWPYRQPNYQYAVALTIGAMIAVRLVCAAVLPLAFDEALYWRWSRHLAGGYYDHPPVTMALIRLGTSLFGDTEFGVRVMGVLLAAPASFAVWRSAAILFDDERVGATAALLFNLTLVMAAGSVIMTPDSSVVVAASFIVLCLAKVQQTGNGLWWLATGIAFGLGMLAKYSTIFFAPGILAWVLLVPPLRRWLATPWPWAAGLIAVLLFTPVLAWNAQHEWASFLYQFNRLVVRDLSLRYVGEFFVTQMALATPPAFVLGTLGLAGFLAGKGGERSSAILLSAMVWPLVLYFTWHSLKGRVEGNWPEPLYPAFMVAAAAALHCMHWRGVSAKLVRWSALSAVPVGIAVAAALYLQAIFGLVPLGFSDPTARALGAGFRDLARDIDAVRDRAGARLVITTDYGLASWLTFYLPSRAPVEQINVRMRYVNEPPLDRSLLHAPMIYVCHAPCGDGAEMVRARFERFEPIGAFVRRRHGVEIRRYMVYRVETPRGDPFDAPAPPPRLK